MCVCAMAYAMFIYTSCAKPTGAVLLAVALLHELKLVLATNGQTQDTLAVIEPILPAACVDTTRLLTAFVPRRLM